MPHNNLTFEVIEERFAHHKDALDRHEERIASLEKMVWKINGIGVLLIVLIEAFSHFR